jgi:hypothetical protein
VDWTIRHSPNSRYLARAIDSSRIGGLICESNFTSHYVFVSTAVVVLPANGVDSWFVAVLIYCSFTAYDKQISERIVDVVGVSV